MRWLRINALRVSFFRALATKKNPAMLGSLLDQVRNAVSNHPDQPGNNFESSGLMSTIEGLFGQYA